jgi:hypothetical protein
MTCEILEAWRGTVYAKSEGDNLAAMTAARVAIP